MKAASSAPFKKQESPSDPHSDPNGERSGYYPADTVDCPQNGKPAKASESFIYQHFERSDVSSHAGGHWFESSSLHQEKTLESQRFRGFFFAFFWKKRASLLVVFWGIFGCFRGFLLQKCCKFFSPLSVVPQGFAGLSAEPFVANFSGGRFFKGGPHFFCCLCFSAFSVVMGVDTQRHVHSAVARQTLDLLHIQPCLKKPRDVGVAKKMGSYMMFR